MIWLTWRLSRLELLLGGGALAIVAVFLIWTGSQMGAFYDDAGLPSCAAQSASDEVCLRAAEDFLDKYRNLSNWIPWLNLLPFVLGLLLAAPTVLDLEQGTHRLVWTQSVTRARWLAVRVAFGVALAVAASIMLIALWSWWRGPYDAIEGRFNTVGFDFEGIAPIAYMLFAFALCLALGALLRRTIPSVGIALVVFLVTRIGVLMFARPHYLAPVRVTWDQHDPPPPAVAGSRFFGDGHWVINDGYVDTAGATLSRSDAAVRTCMMDTASKSGDLFDACLRDQGIMNVLVYQPADRFWAFQAIESALFLGLAAALLGLTFWWVTKRMA